MSYHPLSNVGHHHDKFDLVTMQNMYICAGCKEYGYGCRYSCSMNCNFHLHLHCANPSESIRHPFYPGTTLKFSRRGRPSWCDACRRRVEGYAYGDMEKDLDLHPCCAHLPHHAEGAIAGRPIAYALRPDVSSQCYRCGLVEAASPTAPGHVSGWSYVSQDKTIHFHVACVKDKLDESAATIDISSPSIGGGGSGGDKYGHHHNHASDAVKFALDSADAISSILSNALGS